MNNGNVAVKIITAEELTGQHWSRLPEYFSHSSLEYFQTCKRKYYYSYIQKITPQVHARSLSFGDGFHTGLAVWYKSIKIPEAILRKKFEALMYLSNVDPQVADRAVQAIRNLPILQLREELAIFVAVSTLPPLADYQLDDHRTAQLLESMLRAYFKVYSYEPWKVIHVEQDFVFALPDNSIIMGIVDLAVDWRGGIMPVEHKTTSAMWGYGDTLNPHQQLDIEILGLRTVFGEGKTIPYVCVNVAQIPKRKAGVNAQDFQRFPDVFRSEPQLNEAVINMMASIDDIKRNASREYWPMEKSACHQYGGCPYRRICKESPENREAIISKWYATKETRDHSKARREKDGFLDDVPDPNPTSSANPTDQPAQDSSGCIN